MAKRRRWISLFDMPKKKRKAKLQGMSADFAVMDEAVGCVPPGTVVSIDPAATSVGATVFTCTNSRMTVARRGMRVFDERDGTLREVGWCSAHDDGHEYIRRNVGMRMPVSAIGREVSDGEQFTTVTFETRLIAIADVSGPERVIVLKEGDDPTQLPGWDPFGDLGRPRPMLAPFVGMVPSDLMQQMAEHVHAEIQHQFGNVSGPMADHAVDTLTYARLVEMMAPDYASIAVARDQARQAQDRLYRAEMMARMARPPVGYERYQFGIENVAIGLGYAITRERSDDNLYRSEMFSRPRIDTETAAAAKARSRGLLKSLLTPQQWAEFEAGGAVTEQIEGCEFKLRPGGMIEARKARVLERWCIAPDPWADGNDYMPDEDKLIGQLLHLRAGPERLREKANVFPMEGSRITFGYRPSQVGRARVGHPMLIEGMIRYQRSSEAENLP